MSTAALFALIGSALLACAMGVTLRYLTDQAPAWADFAVQELVVGGMMFWGCAATLWLLSVVAS